MQGMKGDLSWNKILFELSERMLKFVLNGTMLTLPSPDNLWRWKKHPVHIVWQEERHADAYSGELPLGDQPGKA